MTRENLLYGDERLLPYLVRLARFDGSSTGRSHDDLQAPSLVYLDLRGGEFSRSSSARLARIFDWLIRGHRVRHDDVVDYCLEIVALDPDQDFYNVESGSVRRPESWRERREDAFRWIPIPHDENEVTYAWQR
jgi:hypothetical protein